LETSKGQAVLFFRRKAKPFFACFQTGALLVAFLKQKMISSKK
jgi:hypothetical protein